jgi:hypothetical protein
MMKFRYILVFLLLSFSASAQNFDLLLTTIAEKAKEAGGVDLALLDWTSVEPGLVAGYTIDIDYPATINAGDLLLAIPATDYNYTDDESFSAPDGSWTKWNTTFSGNSSGDSYATVFWKIATGSESGSDTFTFSKTDGGFYCCGLMIRLEGSHQTTPFSAHTFEYWSNGSASVHVLPSVDIADDNCLVFALIAGDGSDNLPYSVDGAWTLQDEIHSRDAGSGGGTALGFATKTQATAGETGTATFTPSTTDGAIGYIFAIRPQ